MTADINSVDQPLVSIDQFPKWARHIHQAFCIIDDEQPKLSRQFGFYQSEQNNHLLLATVIPEQLGNLGGYGFCHEYGVSYPYMAGSMANGIASVALVEAITKAGGLASFGAAGLAIDEIEQAIFQLKSSLKDYTYCFNLIHSPNEIGHEDAVVDLYLKHKITLVEASAYMSLTPAVVRYRVRGLHSDPQGNIITPNRIIAKASRVELARQWFNPPPQKILNELLQDGHISNIEAQLAGQVPMATDMTVEADSGGHTDNRPAITLLPTMLAIKDELQVQYEHNFNLRIGAAGGIATPTSVVAAFSLGASYVVTGTINQACVESGSSDKARAMLAAADQADTAMAPAVDMFEIGVKLQVLKRGTMFAMRANKLYEIYTQYNSLESVPKQVLDMLESTIFQKSLAEIWHNTQEYFNQRDAQQIERAEQNAKYKMALIFRWYLGLSSRWANAGQIGREMDYQIWCGPAMGGFNEWSKGSFLADPKERRAEVIMMNLLFGAAVLNRVHSVIRQGVQLPPVYQQFLPLSLTAISQYITEQ